MRSQKMPTTIQRWIDANPGKVDEHWMERDDFGEPSQGPWSVWLYLADGFHNGEPANHIIHETTARDFLSAAQFIDQCDCADCKARLSQ